LYLNRRNPDKRILVVSTDPAHSLGDSFNIVIGNKLTPITDNVWGLEIDSTELLQEYKARHGEAIKKIAERGTYFDSEDIEDFFTQSLPGMDEVMAVIRIADLRKATQYDLIILDTAPTGHTLVLLSLPEEMEKWIDLFDMLMEKHRYMMKTMVGRYRRDECDEFIDSQRKDIMRVRRLLRDEQSTEFVPATIPEPMSISETVQTVKTLKEHRISVKSIIVNRVISKSDGCPFCLARWLEKESYVQQIEQELASYNLVYVPLFPYQIRGEALVEYGSILFGETEYIPLPKTMPPSEQAFTLPTGSLCDILEKEPNFIVFGGKGGVGKTSIAAASALYLAEHKPFKQVLVFSTDPAHALSDSFQQPIGDQVTPISGVSNLFALEVDGTQMLENLKKEYQDDIDEAFRSFLGGTGVDIKFDREVLRDLLSLSPPGLDELMSLQRINDLMKEERYDFFILDSAASGHLVRFLELPRLVQDWLKAVFRLLLKYKNIIRLNKAGQLLVELSKYIKNMLELFTSPEGTELVMITIPEEMAVAEMADLAQSVAELGIPSTHVAINMVIPPTDCGFCEAKRMEQQIYIQRVEAQLPNHAVVAVPLLPHDVRGLDSLRQLAETMYADAGAVIVQEKLLHESNSREI
ncbi:ArsA family ATPase, partial [Chloroflexota bacterium]